MKKEYKKGNTTILWQPEKCIHAAACVRHQPKVFKPKDRPWVQPENGSEEDIIEAVKACPSGALSIK